MNKGLDSFYSLVEAFESLPSIGKKSALRLAYHITMNDSHCGLKIAHNIENAIKKIRQCKYCGNISEHEICEICLDTDRNKSILAIVQSAKDIFAIEESRHFFGKYFVLEKLEASNIERLQNFITFNNVEEVLFAVTPSLANEAYILHIEDKLQKYNLKFSKIAQGVPTGVSLENIDMLSLSKAIQSRVKIWVKQKFIAKNANIILSLGKNKNHMAAKHTVSNQLKFHLL